MERSVFTVVDPVDDPTRDRLTEVVRLAEAADAAGLAALWVAEHHFTPPTGLCPAPAVLLAACAARTQRLRLGSLVSVLPFHPAVDTAEAFALLDRLSGGRLNFGVGSGYLAAEFEGLGVDPATKQRRFEEALDRILRGFRGEAVTWASPNSPAVRLNVQPVQRPHPPVTLAVQRREAVPFVARKGLGIALIPYATVASLGELGEEIREYRSHLPPGNPGRVAVALHVYAGREPERARRALDRYLSTRRETGSTYYLSKLEHHPEAATAAGIEAADLAFLGSAGVVAEKLGRLRALGVDELLAIVDFGDLPFELSLESVRALGSL